MTPRADASRLVVVLPKGRLLDPSLAALTAAGLDFGGGRSLERRLRIESHDRRAEALLVKPQDVVTYVEHGIADLGVVGKDVLLERGGDLYEPLDLGFGACRLVVAGPEGSTSTSLDAHSDLRVATKYPRLTRRHFAARGRLVEVIELAGSVELGPLVGLSEWIVDLVETGETLRQNGLVVVEEIARSSARLVVNRASHKTKYETLDPILKALARVVRRAPAR